MNIPNKLKYTKDHEWIQTVDGYGLVGITDFAQQELGDIVFVEFSSNNNTYNKGETFGTLEAVKTVADLYIPIQGKIIEVNQKVIEDPSLINIDPYGEGWLIKLELNNIDDLKTLLNDKDYKKLIL